jgi:hypothetical protein
MQGEPEPGGTQDPEDDAGMARALESVRLRRSGGIAGVDESVEIRAVDDTLQASTHPFLAEPRTFALDETTAAELIQRAAQVADTQPAATPARRGADMYHYQLTLAWHGTMQEFEVTGAPTDPALHGMITLLAGLLQREG